MINPYITQVRSVDNYCLHLTFENGEERIFDVTPYLDRGIFVSLKDPKLFATVRVVSGSIEWDNELDLSYDTLYLESQSLKINPSIKLNESPIEFSNLQSS